MLFNPPFSQKDLLTKKKQRQQGDNSGFISNKMRVMNRNFRSQIRRKLSQNDLKQAFWPVMNQQSTQLKQTGRNDPKSTWKNQDQKNNLRSNTPQNIQFFNSIQSLSGQSMNRQKMNCDDFHSLQPSFNKIHLPSIMKNGRSLQDIEKCLQKDLISKNQSQNLRNAISLDFDHTPLNSKPQKGLNFPKQKSQSVAIIKNKIKLSKIKQSKFLQNQLQPQQLQSGRSSQNENYESPPQSANQSSVNKQKIFHINNLNLHTKQAHNKIVTKRSFVLKLLQSNENSPSRFESRKNSLVNLIDRQSQSTRKISLNTYQDDNFITKSITFSHPDQVLLKKIMSKIRKQENQSENQNKKKQVEESKPFKQKQKFRKQKINGWDIKRQDQQINFGMDNEELEK